VILASNPMKKLTVSILTIAIVSSAFCQIRGTISPDSTTMTHLWFPGAPSQLIVDRKDVQAELKLSASQVDAIKAIEKTNAKTWMEKVSENWKSVAAVLNPEQRRRTLEIAFQATGIASALVPGLDQQLNLSKDQVTQLATIKHNYLLGEDKDLMESQSAATPETPEQAKAARMLRQQFIVDAVSHVLTESQQAKIKGLQGKPFVFEAPAPKPLSTWIRAMGMSG